MFCYALCRESRETGIAKNRLRKPKLKGSRLENVFSGYSIDWSFEGAIQAGKFIDHTSSALLERKGKLNRNLLLCRQLAYFTLVALKQEVMSCNFHAQIYSTLKSTERLNETFGSIWKRNTSIRVSYMLVAVTIRDSTLWSGLARNRTTCWLLKGGRKWRPCRS